MASFYNGYAESGAPAAATAPRAAPSFLNNYDGDPRLRNPLNDDLASPRRGAAPPDAVTDAQWAEFDRAGFVNVGRVIPAGLLARMQRRAEDIMLGRVRHANLLMQLDPGGAYDTSVQDEKTQTVGWKGATLAYRKVGEAQCGLECDDVFRAAMRLPVFRGACARMYGAHAPIAVYRAMLFNKPAAAGTDLPFHQDGGDWWAVDRDPLFFVWTALEDAHVRNGCVRVLEGTHKLGLLSKRGHTLSADTLARLGGAAASVAVEVKAGESVLMHNWLVHASGTNATGQSRLAFSVNYCDGRTRVLDPKPVVQPENRVGALGAPGTSFPLIFDQRRLPAF